MFDPRGLAIPLVGAPMSGGASTPALAAAVSNAGGIGFLAAGYKSAEAVAFEVEQVRAATSEPFGLNVFVVDAYEVDHVALRAYAHSLADEASRLGAALGEPRWDDDQWDAKLDLLFDLRPDVASFTFGCPSPELLSRLGGLDILTMVTVTTVDEARRAVANGAASLALQGPDAGGHRGTWDLDAIPSTTPIDDVLLAVSAAVDVPIVAGGGVRDADDVTGLLADGAVAALAGTAYLLADEAGTNPVYRSALADPRFEATELTRSYTGRWARGLRNRFIVDHPDAPAGYPQVHHLTAPLRAAAVSAGDADVAHLWAGTGHAAARPASAAEITRSLTP